MGLKGIPPPFNQPSWSCNIGDVLFPNCSGGYLVCSLPSLLPNHERHVLVLVVACKVTARREAMKEAASKARSKDNSGDFTSAAHAEDSDGDRNKQFDFSRTGDRTRNFITRRATKLQFW